MAGHGGGIAEDDELHAGTGDGNIHTAKVAEESNLSFIVGSHHRDEDDITLLSLETINGIHANQVAIRLEELPFLEQSSQILHLCPIRRNDTHIESLVEDTLLPYLLAQPC